MNKQIQHKSFRISDLKYKVDKKLNQHILDLQKQFVKKFDNEERKKLAFSQKVDFVYNTTAMEGNTFTYAETETLLSGVTVGGHELKEENEILNQKEAWKYTLDSAFDNSQMKVNSSFIKDIHFRVGKDTVVKAGQYRDGRVKIGGTNYTPPKTFLEIDNLIELFVQDFEELEAGVFEQAVIAHFIIALIQPFYDGNKRTARLLMNYILLKNNYPLFSIPVKIRKEYIDAMLKGYERLDTNDLMNLLGNLMKKNLGDLI